MNNSHTGGAISSIHRYPVKGLNGQVLTEVMLDAGRCIPFDRAYAIENGVHLFDPASPRYLPKNKFFMLMSHERLAELEAEFSEETHHLRLLRNGKQLAQGCLGERIGRSVAGTVLLRLPGKGASRPAAHCSWSRAQLLRFAANSIFR